MTELLTLLGDDVVGRVRRDRSGRVSFIYEDAWRSADGAYPLSLSMPLVTAQHAHRVVDPYLWGLLPDNARILEQWAKRAGVSAGNAFSLLSHYGEECAGAVRFVNARAPGRALHGGGVGVKWLDVHDVAGRLRALRSDESAWRSAGDAGQFSLAGAQPKTALLLDGKRWGVPSGRVPTTHILKPGAPGLAGHAENEHFCLVLASELGLPVARSWIEHFEDEAAIVIERYDRVRTKSAIVRVHQEDVCQALAVHPREKYETDGGPGLREIARLLRESSRAPDEDLDSMIGALALSWLIGGTDGHAKNYSLLIGAAGRVRLAPFYDIASALPYFEHELRKLKLAMKVGGKYRLREIGRYQWGKLATELGLQPVRVLDRVMTMTREVERRAIPLAERLREEGLRHPVLRKLAKAIRGRARECASLEGPP
jgi:serine/threonine-protein kinase HipA